jgi:ketosteroid isomerase-like protein
MLAHPVSERPRQDVTHDDGGWLAAARDLATQWVAAFNAGDVATLAALYDKDAVMFPTGRAEPLVGADAVRQFFAGMDWSGTASAQV